MGFCYQEGKRHEWWFSKDVGAMFLTGGRMKSPYPLNGCLLWMTTNPHSWGRLTSGLRPSTCCVNFAPCWQISSMSPFFHSSWGSRAHKKRRSIFSVPIQAKVQMLRSLWHAFVCLFPALSFGLFTATFPMITVDKFNVPELGVQAQEGFWSATVDVYHRGYQLTGKKENNTKMCDYIQPKRHQDVWTDVYQGWLTSASHILLLASAEAQSRCGPITPFLQPRGFAHWRHACSTRSGRSRHPRAACAEKLRREKVSSVAWSKQWFMNPCSALRDRLQRGTHRQLWPLTLSVNCPHDR